MSHYESFQGTAHSHLLNILGSHDKPTSDIAIANDSKEVILTLLKHAARLYEDPLHAREAVDLIRNDNFKIILNIAVQCRLPREYQDAVEYSPKEEHDHKSHAFSGNVNHALHFRKHLYELCYTKESALCHPYTKAQRDERFLLRNYIELSRTFTRHEKSWLVLLLPQIFQSHLGHLEVRFNDIGNSRLEGNAASSRERSNRLCPDDDWELLKKIDYEDGSDDIPNDSSVLAHNVAYNIADSVLAEKPPQFFAIRPNFSRTSHLHQNFIFPFTTVQEMDSANRGLRFLKEPRPTQWMQGFPDRLKLLKGEENGQD